MNMEDLIARAVRDCLRSLYPDQEAPDSLQIQPTRKEFEGELTLVVFPLVKAYKQKPEQLGEGIGKALVQAGGLVESFNVVKGFLNLKLKSSLWCSFLAAAVQDESFGLSRNTDKGLVVVEYSSPNTNKPLHLGHLRNNFLGYAVSEILKACGHDVRKVQIINDRGIHICKSMLAWQRYGNGESPESSGMKGDHLVGKYYVIFDKVYKEQVAKLMGQGLSEEQAADEAEIMQAARSMLKDWEEGKAEVVELWKKMNSWVYEGFDATYERMGVDFDKLYYESETWLLGKQVVLDGMEKGVFYKREDQSVWADLSDEGMDEKLLLRKDGTAVYMTQDLGTAVQRQRDFPAVRKMVYTVGNEQEYHFKVLFALLGRMGYSWASDCHHLSYGMVELPQGKMKSREGTVVDADELMEGMAESARRITEELGKLDQLGESEREELYEMIGMAALKYFLLKVDPRKGMLFNPEESIDFNGHTGPFIQYGYARTCALFRKYAAPVSKVALPASPGPAERRLLLKLYLFPKTLQESAEAYNPAILANYIYELVKDFNSFYQQVPILQCDEELVRDFRMQLTALSSQVVKNGMRILGMDVPERM